ncbi:hypothetical protein D3C81_943270 [compost metagenome]
MPRQFLNDSDINRQVGIETMVLSKFCTLTVCKVMSTTSPSAPTCGISIQSPTRSMSLLVSCTLATNDSKVSLYTNRITADMAPRPDSSNSGERSIRVATMMIAPKMNKTIFASCT